VWNSWTARAIRGLLHARDLTERVVRGDGGVVIDVSRTVLAKAGA